MKVKLELKGVSFKEKKIVQAPNANCAILQIVIFLLKSNLVAVFDESVTCAHACSLTLFPKKVLSKAITANNIPTGSQFSF